MSSPSDPNDPTRADLPPTQGGAGDPTVPMERTEATTRAGTAAPVGDRPIREDDDRNKAWWLWALLALAILAVVLFALLRDNDDDGDDVGTVDDTTTETTDPAAEEPAGEDAAAPEDTATDGDAGTDPGATEGTDDGATAPGAAPGAPDADLSDDPGTATTEDDTDLFTLVQGDAGDAERLAPHADSDVVGSGVQVLEVVEGEGFWIGAGDQRIFAHGSSDLAAEVEVGQRIDFDGFLKPNPPADSADVHDIPDEQGAELHRQQGHHIELRSLDVVG